MSVLSNTTVLSNFAGIGSVDVLRLLFGELYVSVEVYQEIQAGFEEGYLFYEELLGLVHGSSTESWIRVTSLSGEEEVDLFLAMPQGLHQGEAASLSIARNRGWLFLTDDKSARAHAKRQKIRISGTLGCLVLAVESGVWSLADANERLGRILQAGFYSPVRDLSSLVR